MVKYEVINRPPRSLRVRALAKRGQLPSYMDDVFVAAYRAWRDGKKAIRVEWEVKYPCTWAHSQFVKRRALLHLEGFRLHTAIIDGKFVLWLEEVV